MSVKAFVISDGTGQALIRSNKTDVGGGVTLATPQYQSGLDYPLGDREIKKLQRTSMFCCFRKQLTSFLKTIAAPMALIPGVCLPGGATDPSYKVERSIVADSKYWDYSSIDLDRRQLYVGRIGGVLALDLDTNAVTETLFAGELIHAVLAIGSGVVVAADGATSELRVYDANGRTLLHRVKVGGHPDAIAFDRRTHTVATANKASGDLTLVDASTWRVEATIKLPGDPEFEVADDNGTLYVNINDKDRLAVVDIAAQRIVREIALPGCREPTGIAYHRKFQLVVTVCSNGLVKVLSAGTLREVASLKVGRGADAVFIDERRNLVFVPAGDDGTLSIIAVRSADNISSVATIKTEKGAGSGAVDADSGRIYLPTGRRLPAITSASGWQPPKIKKGSFHILVIGASDSVAN